MLIYKLPWLSVNKSDGYVLINYRWIMNDIIVEDFESYKCLFNANIRYPVNVPSPYNSRQPK